MIPPSLLVVSLRDGTRVAPSCNSQCSFQACSFFSSTLRWMVASRDLWWVRPCRCGRPSHPPNPGRFFSTHQPTDCFAIDCPRRALFPGGDGETLCSKVHYDGSSKLACTSFLKGGLGCFQLRASTRTARSVNIRSFWCGRWARKRKLPSPPFHYIAEPSRNRALRFHPSPEHGATINLNSPAVWAGALSRQIDRSHEVSGQGRNHRSRDCS